MYVSFAYFLAMKNRSAFRLLIAANLVSGFSQGITMLAIPWYFINNLDEGPLFGMIYALITILSIFWSPTAGTLIDRFPRKSIFQCITFTGGIFLTIIAITGYSIGYMPIYLAATVFGFTMFNYQIHYPTLYAFAQEISEKENYLKVNSLIEVQGQASNVIAGAIGAILLTGFDPANSIYFSWFPEFKAWSLSRIILIDGATYFVACALVSFIRYTPINQGIVDTGAFLQRLKAGYQFLMNHKTIFLFGNASYSVFVFLLVQMHLLLPMYIGNHLDEDVSSFAISELFYSIGALLTGVLIGKLVRKFQTIDSIIGLMILASVIAGMLVVTKSIWVLLLFSLLIGVSNAGTRVLRVSYLFNHIPNNIIGRTGSVFHMINIIFRFLFILLFSWSFFDRGNNVIYAYLISSIFILGWTIPLVINRKKLQE